MIEDIIVKKGKKNFYNINVKDGEEYKNLVIFLKDCICWTASAKGFRKFASEKTGDAYFAWTFYEFLLQISNIGMSCTCANQSNSNNHMGC